jgi:predicted DNA-binding ribbon-helix-helix protein
MKSAIIKRSITISGHKTSLSLEDAFWECLQQIAKVRDQNVHRLVTRSTKIGIAATCRQPFASLCLASIAINLVRRAERE